MPDLHLHRAPDSDMDALDDDGEAADWQMLDQRDAAVETAGPRYRLAAGTFGPAPDVALGTDRDTAAAAHAHRGRPDGRRTQTEHRGDPAAPAAPVPGLHTVSDRVGTLVHHSAPPSRYRAGSTGADPARLAEMQLAYTVRPFDQVIAPYFAGIDKVRQDQPLAAMPPARARLVGARPSASGTTAERVAGVGQSRDTARETPTPWAAGHVSGVAAAPTSTWRLT